MIDRSFFSTFETLNLKDFFRILIESLIFIVIVLSPIMFGVHFVISKWEIRDALQEGSGGGRIIPILFTAILMGFLGWRVRVVAKRKVGEAPNDASDEHDLHP